MEMRVIICGSRNWKEEKVIPEDRIETYIKTLPRNAVIIHGGGPGADTIVDRVARERGHTVIERKANWDLYGDAAGPIRNKEMLDFGVDKVVGFHEDIINSKGTKDMLARARKARIPIVMVNGTGVRQTELGVRE